MSRRKKRQIEKRETTKAAQIWLSDAKAFHDLCVSGYTRLSDCPEVMGACYRIAELIASTTIYLMNSTADGDVRITNELSRAIDIEPMPNMTRYAWMQAIVMNLLLHGSGNSIAMPHTWKGLIQSLEPISAERVQFQPIGYRDYKVLIDGKEKDPANLLHFTYNPDPTYLWKGRGMTASLRDVARALRQAARTEQAFLSSEYKPSIVVKVDGLVDEFASQTGREKLAKSYLSQTEAGAPWIIPADLIDIQQVKPLSLADLAVNDTVTLDRRMVASILGVPAFFVGVGDYNRDEYNAFIQGRVMSICKGIAQELTKKLIINPAWYWSFNVWSLIDYDIKTVSDVLLAGSDRGFVCGDEWRDRMHMNPAGLKEFKILENYIPYDMSGNQKKLEV